MTTKSSKNDAITTSRMNFADYIRQETLYLVERLLMCAFSSIGLEFRVWIRLSVHGLWLVSGYAHVFVLVSVVIALYPLIPTKLNNSGTRTREFNNRKVAQAPIYVITHSLLKSHFTHNFFRPLATGCGRYGF